MRTYEIGLYEKAMPNDLSLADKLETARELGYDYLELSIDETDEKLQRLDWTTEQIEDLLRACALRGLPIGSLCLSGHRKYPLGSENEEERSLEIMEKAIRLAAGLGIRVIQLAGYDVYYEESDTATKSRFLENLKAAAAMAARSGILLGAGLGIRVIQLAGYDVYYEESDTATKSRFLENLKAAAAMAARSGILLGFETMETPFMDTVWKSMFYVQAVNSPYLGIYPDTGNLTNAAVLYGTDPVLDLESGHGHIVALHLKETIPGHYREIPFGTGHVDFDSMIALYGTDPVLDLESGHGHIVALHLKETIPGHYREIPFGTGHVDFDSMIAAAWKLGVRRYVTEMWYVGQEDWKQDIKKARSMMSAILDRQIP